MDPAPPQGPDETDAPPPPVSEKGRRLLDYGFFIALGLAALLLFLTVRGLIAPVLLGAAAAVLARPLEERLRRVVRGRRRVAAAMTTLVAVVIVLLPVGGLVWLAATRLPDLVGGVLPYVRSHSLSEVLGQLRLPGWLRAQISAEQLADGLQRVAAEAGTFAAGLVGRLWSLAIAAVLFVIGLFYFLVDGERWRDQIERVLPIDRRYTRGLIAEFEKTTHALFFGSIVVALLQGCAATIGYLIFGIGNAPLWGIATAVMAFVPIIGTASVWLPMGIVQLALGDWVAGLGVLGWGLLFIGLVDNLATPYLLRGRMRLHPLLVFLSLIGGLRAFGPIGLFLGPLSASLFVAVGRIYRRDFRDRWVTPSPSTKENAWART
jgi:predicted PurR-regulated permease PerM